MHLFSVEKEGRHIHHLRYLVQQPAEGIYNNKKKRTLKLY